MDLDQEIHLGVHMLRIQSPGEVQFRGSSEGGPVGLEPLVVPKLLGRPPLVVLLENKICQGGVYCVFLNQGITPRNSIPLRVAGELITSKPLMLPRALDSAPHHPTIAN